MTAPRRRPVLTAPLGPEGRKRLAGRIAGIHERGEAARAKLAAATGGLEGRADIGRLAQTANRPDPLERRIAKAEANAVHLANLGNRIDAARAERTAKALRTKLARLQREAAAERAREAARAARLDRFGLLVKRSDVLTVAHYLIGERWLAALEAAADGEMARAAVRDAAPDDGAAQGQPSGPAIFLRGAKALDRWKTAVPVDAVAGGRRRLPPVFEPKRVKTPRAGAQGGAPPRSLPEACLARRSRAELLMVRFVGAMAEGGFPGWCAPVAVRVILRNESLTHAFVALGVPYGERNRIEAQTAMAAGLMAIAPLVDKWGV